jgi:hypothetical protein
LRYHFVKNLHKMSLKEKHSGRDAYDTRLKV